MVKISASILSADFSRLAAHMAEAERSGVVDRYHLDMMDGVFVPPLTFGPLVAGAVRPHTSLPLVVHMMVERPDRFYADFAKAGMNRLLVHVETCPHLHRDLQSIKELGMSAGVAINPGTTELLLSEILGDVDEILVMTVNPGWGGQKLIPETLEKIRRLARMRADRGLSFEIGADGGVNAETAQAVVEAGTDVLIAGSALFGHPEGAEAGARALAQAGKR